MIRGVKALKSKRFPETTFLCLSNANQVYIDTILKVNYLPPVFISCITQVYKYPGARFDRDI